MIVIGLISACVLWCMFYGLLPIPLLAAVCTLCAATFAILSRHEHGTSLEIDIIAQKSKLISVNPGLKIVTALTMLVCCVASQSPWVGVAVATVSCAICLASGVDAHDYLSLLSIPVLFVVVSGIALLFDYSPNPIGVINIPIANGYLYVSSLAQQTTILILARVLGAVSSLYVMSLTTPLVDSIEALRKIRIPSVIISLMFLIYRCIFLLLDMYRNMHNAAQCRLGFSNYPTSIKTFGIVLGNLFARSMRSANTMFDAMESRCFEGNLRFWSQQKPILAGHATICCVLCALCILATLATALL